MKTVNFVQGSAEWHAHRAQHWNASDAPAMLGVSPYKTRAQLLRERATGVGQEIDDATQRRFDDGHRFEALARPLAEAIIGEELYPCTGVLEGTKLSASFDGLTLLEDIAWEHKSLNDELRAAMVDGCTGADLPMVYQVQCEQQSMTAERARVLFMASKWNGDELVEERHCWYEPNPELAKRIVAGWEQFETDLASYQFESQAAAAPAGRAPDQLPALSVQVTGMVTASNLAEFKANAMAVLGSINRDLKTDEDFANADKAVKWCQGVEERLEATKQQVLGQTADIEAVFRTMDEVKAEAKKIRLELDKLVTKQKETRKEEIVQAGATAVRTHYETINSTLGEHRIQPPQSLMLDIGAVIKGKKSLSSMKDAVDTAVANFKIAASESADRVRANVHVFEMELGTWAALFPDRVQLCASKTPEDLRNLMNARISEGKAEEERRAEEKRQRDDAAVPLVPAVVESPAPAPMMSVTAPVQSTKSVAEAASTAKIKLGDLNARIAPITVTADGLRQLGFDAAAKERGACLYREADFPHICHALAKVLEAATQKKAA